MIDRRTFLAGTAALLVTPSFSARGDGHAKYKKPPDEKLLLSSPYVYVSPLLADGKESTCHGEVWYAWLDDSVVTTTAASRWKARSIKKGLDRARIWVGDYGRWKRPIGRNEAFRAGPSFVASGALIPDDGILDRLLDVYAKKYPDEIAKWRNRMRREVASGERVIIRYTPKS